MAIDIGSPAIDRNEQGSGTYTTITVVNPANAEGVVDHLEVYVGAQNTKDFATFFLVSGSNYSTRGYTEGLLCTAGFSEHDAPGDFTAFDVEIDDMIGMWNDTADRGDGVGGCRYLAGDKIPVTDETFADYLTEYSLWAEGTESGAGVAMLLVMLQHDHFGGGVIL